MDLENGTSNILKEYFKNNIKLSFVTKDNVILVTKEDKVYEFERDLKTTIDLNKIHSLIESKNLVELNSKGVVDFKKSPDHTIARTIDGKVYCWGKNNYGGIGNDREDPHTRYKPVANDYLNDKYITDICCGQRHSLALTFNGEVYAWGYNAYGQIGNESSRDFQFIPTKLNGFDSEKVVMISCGYRHSMALTESGRVFSWGNNSFGQLGYNNVDTDYLNKPTLVPMSNEIPIEKICCGRTQSLFLSRDGDIYSNKMEKLSIDKNKFKDIAAYYDCGVSIALSFDNVFYVWSNLESEIGMTKEPKETKFKSFDDIFSHYFGVNYRPIEGFIQFKIEVIKNGKYREEYKEIEKIGEGCCGDVFKVQYLGTNYALKKMYFTNDDKEELLKELENCVTVHSLEGWRLNLLKFDELWLEFNETSGNVSDNDNDGLTLYMKMELYDKTLEEVIKEIHNDTNLYRDGTLNSLGYFIACFIFNQILEGVHYLHDFKPQILHMDLHPGNILLKKSIHEWIEIKLADFGFAKICEIAQNSRAMSMKNSSTGSVNRSRASRNGSYSTKNDVLSLGEIMKDLFLF
jgi:alpha-tubulin suppressor-like RCC1 family protein